MLYRLHFLCMCVCVCALQYVVCYVKAGVFISVYHSGENYPITGKREFLFADACKEISVAFFFAYDNLELVMSCYLRTFSLMIEKKYILLR